MTALDCLGGYLAAMLVFVLLWSCIGWAAKWPGE